MLEQCYCEAIFLVHYPANRIMGAHHLTIDEHAALLDANNQLLAIIDGENDKIELASALFGAYAGKVKRIIHNHPSGSALSFADLKTAASFDLEIVALATHEKGEYRARILVGTNQLSKNYKEAFNKLDTALNRLQKKNKINQEQRNLITDHCMNLLLYKKGIIHYEFLLTPKLEKYLKKINLEKLLEN